MERGAKNIPGPTLTDSDASNDPGAVQAADDRDSGGAIADDTGVGVGARLGRYKIVERIGEGGMGVVFAAHDPELDRTVAAKLMRPDGRWSPERELRLRREGQVMARLSHPNVIRVYDVGEAFGSVFVAMEFVDGGTLRDWLDAAPRTQREILDAFAQAGRGLAAAHDAGLVHRDFKPSNVLVGKDGRVLVTDFGIARPITDADPASDTADAVTAGAALRTVTRTGSLPGTPKYMAPEQHQGKVVDARADQFSFCMSLWEALYGASPFAGETWQELAAAKAKGELAAPPASARVPAHIHAALVRGLQPEPTARFPSLHALLAALANDPVQRRRARIRNAAILGGMLVTGFGTAWALASRTAADGPTCPVPTERVAGVWNDARRTLLRTAFSATGSALAEDAFARTARGLDAYLRDWSALHTEVCAATRIRHEQSEDVLDLRMECLGRRLQEVDAQIEALAKPDAKIVEKAPRIVSSLPNLAECSDVAALRAPVRPPSDPATRVKLEHGNALLARALAANRVARYSEAVKLAEATLAEARAIGYRPLEAEALAILGMAQHFLGDAEVATKSLEDAAFVARGGRHTRAELWAWTDLVWLGGRYGKYKEAHAWARHAHAAFESIGGNDELPLATLLLAEGTLLAIEGKFEEALALERRALAIREKALGPDHDKTGAALEAIARVLGDMGRYQEMEQTIRRGLAIYEKQLGPDHPETASGLFNLAFALGAQGRYDEAIAAYRRVVANWERNLGKQHRRLAIPVANIGALLAEHGKLDEALPYLERALALAETNGPEHADVALALFNIADVKRRQGKHDEALARFRRAATIWEKSFGSDYALLAYAFTGIGQVELARGAPARARPLLERALAIREKQPGDLAAISDTRFALARALWETGDRTRARELATKARADHASLGGKSAKQLAEIDAWLAARR